MIAQLFHKTIIILTDIDYFVHQIKVCVTKLLYIFFKQNKIKY